MFLKEKQKDIKITRNSFALKKKKNPIEAINQYLSTIYNEAQKRGYNFSKEKIDMPLRKSVIKITDGQLQYERKHLLQKLKIRDKKKHSEFLTKKIIQPNPMFKVIEGDVEQWEKVN